MSNYDFDSFLKEKFNNNPKFVLDNYSYINGDYILEDIENINAPKDLDPIINKIVLWKTNRVVEMDDDAQKGLLEIKNIREKEDAIGKDKLLVEKVLKDLLKSKGIKLAMASTLMHFFNPNVFPIFDQRAYRVIYLRDYKESTSIQYNISLYLDYLNECINYYNNNLKRYNINFSDTDKYLYQIDKEIGNKTKIY